ncbi:inositol monophosphatase family protein [Marinicella meishanensis]|uniref:inositol monophosphatase family protein n=1 Tax=Marinicella meishanensis TaxID=2873263 RepID=UPI001CBF49C9|nr:inositol monophosphatase family protein [Marinicella sp. NBU2979]
MSPELNIAKKAALKAANSIEQLMFKNELLSVNKKLNNGFVEQAVKVSLNDIFYTLKRAYPEDEIQTDEQTLTEHQNPNRVWLINPLIGTTNFLHGIPHCAISITLLEQNKTKDALVYNPITDEEYVATKGKGAFLNQRRLRISNQNEPQESFVGTNQATDIGHQAAQSAALRLLSKQVADVRIMGCPALDLAMVAGGQLNAYWQSGLSASELLPGVLLVEEAGGQCMDYAAGRDFLGQQQVVAGNLKVAAWLSTQLKSIYPA